jgi:predicted nucleic acid-binding protein
MASSQTPICPIVFVDTSVLLKADDAYDATQQTLARNWLHALWQRRIGRVSTQVLGDYYVTATRHFGMSMGDARAKVRRFQLWKPWEIDHQTVETAWGVEARFGFTYSDALVVAAAAQSGASHVLTLELKLAQHLHQIDGITMLNPFLTSPDDLTLTE